MGRTAEEAPEERRLSAGLWGAWLQGKSQFEKYKHTASVFVGRNVTEAVRYQSFKREVHGYDGSFWVTSHCERARLLLKALSDHIKLTCNGCFDPSHFNWHLTKYNLNSKFPFMTT